MKYCIPFNPLEGIKIQNWLKCFEYKCSENNLTGDWKIKNNFRDYSDLLNLWYRLDDDKLIFS